jgi:hypothetical protein
MSEWTARHDDSKILQRVRSAQVVRLGSYGMSAKSPVTDTRKSDQIRRPHFELLPRRGNYFDRCKESNSRVVGRCHRTCSADSLYFLDKWTPNLICAVLRDRKIIFTIVDSCYKNTQASQFIALTFSKGQQKTSQHEIGVVRCTQKRKHGAVLVN